MSQAKESDCTAVDAVLLAGGSSGRLETDGSKGLLSIDGKPMFDYVLSALQGSRTVGRIAVVMPEEPSERELSDKVLFIDGPGSSITGNIIAGLQALGVDDDELVLVVSADIPLLSEEAIDDFVFRAEQSGADICYPIIPRDVLDERFPDSKRTYVKVREGVFTGGNMGLVRAGIIRDRIDILEGFYDKRKSPLRLVEMLGVRLLSKYLLKIVSISDLEKRLSKLLQAKGVALETDYSEVGFDVDKPSDLDIVVREIKMQAL